MDDTINLVHRFHTDAGLPIENEPVIPSPETIKLRLDLLKEELGELEDAIKARDILSIADGLADIQYVLDGAFLSFGLWRAKLHLVHNVHESNMSKGWIEEPKGSGNFIRGEFQKDKNGKIQKGPNYVPPTLDKVLDRFFVNWREVK